IYKKISELSTLCGGEIPFITFSSTGKPYSFGHPSIESIAKHISMQANALMTPLMLLLRLTLNLKELYEQDERFAELINLIFCKRDKKIAAISSMHPLMDEDVLSAFPPSYGPNMQ
ncbi:hypothetical protein Goshw_018592, partial [Gossypium schwendimanii]|nr:hypothetical protein [Gossypium schwendimanii]